MFRKLGDIISRSGILILIFWVAAFIGLRYAAPPFNDLARGGTFAFLPEKTASRQGEELMERAFPGRKETSNIVVVVYRGDEGGLTDNDRSFVDDQLKPKLEEIRNALNAKSTKKTLGSDTSSEHERDFISAIHTFSDRAIGHLLVSEDAKSTLVTIDLSTDFQDRANLEAVDKVESVLQNLRGSQKLPKGLTLALTGSATLGRDIYTAEEYSASNTGPLTVGMVIVLLVIIYRAPLLALVPLLTFYIAVDVSLNLLTLLAGAGYVPLFRGLKEYTTVLSYGPGVDYCLFLIARYKENLQDCDTSKDALPRALGQVGSAITASATTVICGIGMLSFAEFGKFHDAGIAISVALVVTLLATLTLAPSLLSLTGHWVFWPKPGVQCNDQSKEVITDGNRKPSAIVQSNMFTPIWTYMGELISHRPVQVLVITASCMLPFMVIGLMKYDNVSYGLLELLPHSATSSAGASVLEKDFPAGITGPVQVLIENRKLDFSSEEGIEMIENLSEQLMRQKDHLSIVDIRSVAAPLGTRTQPQSEEANQSTIERVAEHKNVRRQSVAHYVSSVPGVDYHVTQVDVILSTNPFSIDSSHKLQPLFAAIHDALPDSAKTDTRISFVGPTASVHDLQIVNHSDQQHIFLLVVVTIFVILILLLRSVTVSVYLILTVLFSYISTLGVTWLLFYGLDPHGFVGLDWTVPVFLFVVLIAVGEDYNIFLVTRIHEEQARNGPVPGIQIALARTGGIITSCGFIMAGTFASLGIGTLIRMQQLGFALAFGVIIDTCVIRPILVPAFLVILNDQRYGNLIRYLK